MAGTLTNNISKTGGVLTASVELGVAGSGGPRDSSKLVPGVLIGDKDATDGEKLCQYRVRP